MPSPGKRRPLFTLPRVIMSILLAASFAGLYVAFTLHDDSPNPRLRPQAVRTVSPEPDSLQLRQTEIFVELAATYTASLTVNDIPIPDDQLETIEGLNRFSFTPGPEREIEKLPAGRTCAVVSYSQLGGGGLPGSFKWCFDVARAR